MRLDGGFAHPQLLDFLDAEPGVEYVVAMAKNAVLKRKAKRAMGQARQLSRRSGKTEHIYEKPTTPPGRGRETAASSSKPRWCGMTARAQRQPALRHHQPEAKPAVDLRRGLLPAR